MHPTDSTAREGQPQSSHKRLHTGALLTATNVCHARHEAALRTPSSLCYRPKRPAPQTYPGNRPTPYAHTRVQRAGHTLWHTPGGAQMMRPDGMGWRSVVVRGALLLVGLGVHEAVDLRRVAQPHLDHPAVAKGVLVHLQHRGQNSYGGRVRLFPPGSATCHNT